ncbi:MAG: YraN family protein [Bacteroidales bacterium]|nr:YraN family protein [Bacteroidales bacterium]
MKTDRTIVGRKGEEEASRYLARLGHRILARNWRGGHLELDIITLLGSELHFVEVKSRVAPVMAEPERNVGRTKQRRMVAAAQAFLHGDDRKDLPADLEIFFDVMSVVFYGTGAEFDIEYYPKAFVPLYA